MKVCIAEKPSVAREIAQLLGANTRKDGYIEGNGYQVTWVFGHLCTLKEPHDYSSVWKRWDLCTLPMMPNKFGIKIIQDQGAQKQFETIKTLLDNATEVINCGDAGQEGELIQRWVLHLAECKAPVKRLWVSSLTEEALKLGFENLKSGNDYDSLYAAGSARAIGDWLLGMNATRLYSLKYGNGKNVLSIGRVQTPTLALVVKRQLEIDHFQPKPYWELKTNYRDVTFSVKTGRYDRVEDANTQLEQIKGELFKITSAQTKNGKEAPPRLFDLTSLQVECNKKFGFTADETLKLIQSLYEKKLTTYPRVDTTYLSTDIYKNVPGILKGLQPYQQLIAPILAKPIPKSKKVFDDKKITDHHAIIPTGKFDQTMMPNEKMVFDLVSRRFIAAFYPDCKIANTTVEGEVNKIGFKATGKQILEPGWRVVFGKDSSSKPEDNIMPAFVVGEEGEHTPDLVQKETQPPKLYTEATLLRAMESAGKSVDNEELRELMKENGIGRPSTRANIIETLFRRQYIIRQRKNILATQTGVELIGVIENELLKSPELTGQWELKLRQIESKSYEVNAFMEEMRQMVNEIVWRVKQSPKQKITIIDEAQAKEKLKAEKKKTQAIDLSCPICKKGNIVRGKSLWGCTNYNNGCEFRLPFEFEQKKLTDTQIKSIVTKGISPEIKGFVIGGEKVNGKLTLDEQGKLSLEPVEEAPLQCPKCKSGHMIKGNSAWGCSNYRSGCHVLVPFEIFGKKISESNFKRLISKGETTKMKGLTSTDGSTVDGKLSFSPEYGVIIAV